MKAVILAAGRGSRLKPHTDNMPKMLLRMGQTTLIHRTLELLRRLGIQDVSIVVGYLKEKFFETFSGQVKFFVNENYAKTDQAASLLKAREVFQDDVLVMTGDLLCPEDVYVRILRNRSEVCVAVEKIKQDCNKFNDSIEKVLFKRDQIIRIGKTQVANTEANGEFLGLTKINKSFCVNMLDRLETKVKQNQKSALIHIFQDLLDEGKRIDYIECHDEWCEVDDPASFEKAKRMLTTGVYR